MDFPRNSATLSATHALVMAAAIAAAPMLCLAQSERPATNEERVVSVILATYNLRVPCDEPPYDWTNRLPRVLASIEAGRFSIFGVQEAVKRQLDDILAATGFAKIGGGRNDFADGGEHSCIVYDPKRFTLLDGGTFALSETPGVAGSKSWKTGYPRIATWGKFRDAATGKDFCYYNTHLDNRSRLAREEGIKLIISHAREKGGGLPLVLTGDFNASPASVTYETAAAFLRDAAKVSETGKTGPEATFHAYHRRRVPQTPIDFIFVSDSIRVKSFAVDGRKYCGDWPSDHYPVYAELVF